MNISRRHFSLLASISIFTGIIAPSVGNTTISYPYALTNMQYVTYAILVGLILLSLCILLQWRKISYLITATLIILILLLCIMTIIGVTKNFSGDILQHFSWGWIFLCIGFIFLIISFQDEEKISSSETALLSEWYEKILSITSVIIFIILTVFIVLIAEKNAGQTNYTSILGRIFSQDITQVNNIITSPAFTEITHLSYNRSNNHISFLAKDSSGKTFLYPEKMLIENPENITSIHHFHEKTFIIEKDGSVKENNTHIGHTSMKTEEIIDVLAFQDKDHALHIISQFGHEKFYPKTQTASLFFYNTQTKDIYWRERIDDKDQIFKNGQPFSEAYPNILRYTISDDNGSLLITEEKDGTKFVVKNNTTIHTILPQYIRGTLRMNTSDVLYAIKNDDDSSFSIVLNGVVLERRLDEIRELFLEQNTSGFAYFGRPQGESKYCLFTRYRGNLCGLQSYMNPSPEADNSAIVFSGFREGQWSIYRNSTEAIRNSGYTPRKDISHDYFFFDKTKFRHYFFVEKKENGYIINKMGKIYDKIWEDIDVENIVFDYEKILFIAKDTDGWKIVEM